jgi:uncharacterized protein (DUF2336 family)
LDLSDMNRLAELAADPAGTPRGEIYMAVASLYRSQAALLSPRERSLMREILQRLTRDVEMAIRIKLAERLADDPDAPLDLILLLCDDTIEVARPLILRSRKLTDEQLLALVKSARTAHQTACAERPHIGEPVTEALAEVGAEPVLVALLRNVTAKIAGPTFETLVEKSRALPSLQELLAHRGDLPAPLANQMCDWVSDALKQHISTKFPVEPQKIEQASKAVQMPPAPDPLDGGRKLVDKLAAAGQLRAGFLLRVLHQGQIDLFEIAFGKMLGLETARIKHVLYESGPRPVALACRAVGIDRCVFSTVYNLSRQRRGMRTSLSGEERAEVEAIFDGYSKAEAQARLCGRPFPQAKAG